MSIHAPPSLGGFRDSINRMTMNGCDLRTGAGTPVALLHGCGRDWSTSPAAARPEHRAVRGDRPRPAPGRRVGSAPRAPHGRLLHRRRSRLLEVARVGGAIAQALAAR
jgi:hypothetical protein